MPLFSLMHPPVGLIFVGMIRTEDARASEKPLILNINQYRFIS